MRCCVRNAYPMPNTCRCSRSENPGHHSVSGSSDHFWPNMTRNNHDDYTTFCLSIHVFLSFPQGFNKNDQTLMLKSVIQSASFSFSPSVGRDPVCWLAAACSAPGKVLST